MQKILIIEDDRELNKGILMRWGRRGTGRYLRTLWNRQNFLTERGNRT